MDVVNVPGTKLAYVEKGSGSPVVFVHGGLSDRRTWSAQVASFAASGHRAIAYSRRYAWPNEDILSGADPMDLHVEDLATLLVALRAEGATLVGNSWGAYIALVLAARRPDLVGGLVLQEPPLLPLVVGDGSPAAVEAGMARYPEAARAALAFAVTHYLPAAAAFEKGDAEAGMFTFLRGVLGEEGIASLPDARLRQMRDNLGALAAQARIGGGFTPLAESEIRAIRAPTLLLEGERTPAIFRELTRVLRALLPHAAHAIVPGASHMAHEAAPDAYDRIVLARLRTLAPVLPGGASR